VRQLVGVLNHFSWISDNTFFNCVSPVIGFWHEGIFFRVIIEGRIGETSHKGSVCSEGFLGNGWDWLVTLGIG
jgi:hypothetical protein